MHLGGLFVSFMSGNSTRLGVSLAQGHWSNAAEAIGLILLRDGCCLRQPDRAWRGRPSPALGIAGGGLAPGPCCALP
ncbi:MAG: DUF1275 family protein [Bradyrhizobium sp.]